MPDSLTDLGAEYQRLRATPSHFSVAGAAWNADTDTYGGRKHLVMQELGQRLGVAGTPALHVLNTMGAPDAVTNSVDAGGIHDTDAAGEEGGAAAVAIMPGPVMPDGVAARDTAVPHYFVYEWRGKHDYLWFRVNSDEKVEASGWYMAGE